MQVLTQWNSFYVIVGTAAGGLIGLQFVVLTLLAERPPLRFAEAGAAFSTPTIVHFGVVLFLSALLHAPWERIDVVAALWGVTGLGGLVYTLIVAWRMRNQAAYEAVLEDWAFHAALPLVAYATLALSSFAAAAYAHDVLFAVGGATLLLLFVGIHNAWDSVFFQISVGAERRRRGATGKDESPSPANDHK